MPCLSAHRAKAAEAALDVTEVLPTVICCRSRVAEGCCILPDNSGIAKAPTRVINPMACGVSDSALSTFASASFKASVRRSASSERSRSLAAKLVCLWALAA